MSFPNAKEREFLEQLDGADNGPKVTLLRQLKDSDVVCPAGSRIGDACVHCRVEDHVIDGRLDPTSVEAFCTGDHKLCPSWRLEKDRIAANKKPASYVAEGRKEKERAQAIKESHKTDRYERARYLLYSSDDVAVKFRRRNKLPEPDPVLARRVLAGELPISRAA